MRKNYVKSQEDAKWCMVSPAVINFILIQYFPLCDLEKYFQTTSPNE